MSAAGSRGWVLGRRRSTLGRMSVAVAGVLAAQLLAAAPALAGIQPRPAGGSLAGLSPMALRAWHHLGLPPQYRPVPGHREGRMAIRRGIPRADLARPAPRVSWPAAGTAVAAVPAASAAGPAPHTGSVARGWAQAGGLPVSVAAISQGGRAAAGSAAVSRVRVGMAGQAAARAAGVAGVLFTLSRGDGSAVAGRARVRVSYAGFASAYGGGYAASLRLVEMPGCVLTTPAVRSCREMRPLPTANDFTARTLTAQVAVPGAGQPPIVLATPPSTSGGTGDFKGTSLTPSSSWQVGLQTGDFTWSYPMRVPPPIGGAAPRLGLAYDSGSIDGETAQSNSQPGQLGEGFSLTGGGFIERKYASCGDLIPNLAVNQTDQHNKTGDLCWDGNNAYLNLDGRSTEIIYDPSTKAWRLASDDGSSIQELTGATNWTHNGEYWELITPDGTQYFFGRNEFPGFGSSSQQTHSAWTVPVVGLNGNDSNSDGCYTGTPYASDKCTAMAWRWNLDLVIDPNGNATEYFYNPETSYYSFDSYVDSSQTLHDGTKMSYTTGGTLSSIGYGLQSSSLYATQPFQVNFTYAPRCTLTPNQAKNTSVNVATCDSASGKSNDWPDTPWYLYCSSTDTCSGSGHEAPSFYDTQMLTEVTTSVNEGGSSPVSVYTWDLSYSWLSSENGGDLFLSSLQHTGDVGGSLSPGKVTFAPTAMINRVPVPGDGNPAMTRYRIGSITDENLAQINVTYNTYPSTFCTSPPAPMPHDFAQPCFQQAWADGDIGGQMVTSWFYKYTVSEVDVLDQTGGEPMMPTYYYYNTMTTDGYLNGAAWHYDTDLDLVLPKYKSYSQWRGYQHVFVVTGQACSTCGPQSQTDYTFFRGMDGNPYYDSSTGKWVTQPATVTDSRGNTYTDSLRANGFTLEKITDNGKNGPVVSDQISKPWISAATATSASQPWGGTLTAQLDGTAQTDTYAPAVSGTRHTQVVNTYNGSTGLVSQTDDEGDVTVSAQERCTGYSYAQNTAANVNMLDYPSQVTVTSGPCGATSPPLISNTRYYYDGSTTLGAAPTDGNVTETDVYSANDPGVADHWVKQSRDTYDSYGRVTSSEDAAGNVTTTGYTSSFGAGLATTQVKVTDPLGHVTTTDLFPEWGSAKDVIDPSGETTSYKHDPLGRVTAVWLPGQSQAKGQSASYTYAYTPASITSTSTQPPAITTGRLIDAAGNLYVTTYQLFDSLLRARQTQVPIPAQGSGSAQAAVTDTFYDSRGNVATQNGPYPISPAPSTSLYATTEAAVPDETASSYDGAGRVTEKDLDSYGALQWKTTWAYPGIDAVTITPPAGGTATTTYTDARGHTTDIYQYHSSPPPTTPPAAGTGSLSGATGWDHTSYTYTPAGQLSGITDPAGNTWVYGYDLLGRRITATTPDTGTATSSYNDLSQLISATDARGKTISYSYDADGRPTFKYDTTGGAAPSASNELAAWTYDTAALDDPNLPAGSQAIGQPATATAYVGGTTGETYQQSISKYDPSYQPESTTYTIQGNTFNSALDGSYTFTTAYNTDGTIRNIGYPAGGGLQCENLYYNYNTLGQPYSAFSQNLPGGACQGIVSDYAEQSYYSYDGQPSETDLATSQGAKWSQTLNTYDPATLRLTEAKSNAQTASGSWATVADTSYGYDNAGDVTSISDAVTSDTQCLQYDYDQRLTTAWAQTSSTCPTTPPGASGIGGPAPYLQKLTYDSGGAGNITKDNLTVPGTTDNTTLTYPQPGQPQPHTPSTITSTVNGTATTSNPGYNPAGDLQTTGTGATAQNLTWNPAGQLTKLTDATGDTTSYRYDATGSLLLRKDNTTTTLYLPGEEITATGSTLTATRYYTHGGQVIAARTPTSLDWLIADPHGTDTLAIDATSTTPATSVTHRYYTPFGAPLGTPPATWPGDHGFIGGTTDTITSLTNLGAREYDPTQATFISPDPLQAPYDPQDLNPYNYAQDNPATLADPTGAYTTPGPGAGCPGTWQYCEHEHGGNPNPPPDNDPSPCWGCGEYGDHYGGGTVADPYPGQYLLPERDRAAYIEWSVQNPVPFASSLPPAGIELDSINLFCANNGRDCPTNLANGAEHDWVFVANATVGGGLMMAGALGRGGDTAAGGPGASIDSREEPAALEDLAQLACGQSFTPTTRVLLASGKTLPIADLKPGNKVLATNTRTDKTQAEPVTAVLVHHDTDLFDLAISSGGRTSVIGTTSNHPFWDAYLHHWVAANKLSKGEHLKTANGVTAVADGGITPKAHDGWMWDLTVPGGGDHDFYIVLPVTAVLVHNCPTEPGSNETIHSTVRGGEGERGIESTEVMRNAQNMYYDENGNQVYVWDQNNGMNQITIRDPANGNIVTNQWSTSNWVEQQIESERWYLLDG